MWFRDPSSVKSGSFGRPLLGAVESSSTHQSSVGTVHVGAESGQKVYDFRETNRRKNLKDLTDHKCHWDVSFAVRGSQDSVVFSQSCREDRGSVHKGDTRSFTNSPYPT